MSSVIARAEEYLASGAFGQAPMGVLSAWAYLDMLNGVSVAERMAWAERDADGGSEEDEGSEEDGPDASSGKDESGKDETENGPADDGPDGGAGDDGPGGPGPGGPGPDGPGGAPRGSGPRDPGSAGSCPVENGQVGVGSGPGAFPIAPASEPRPPRLVDFIVPLRTLLGLAGRPGEVHGFGLLDPALARELAVAAAASPRTEVCVTVTSPEGYVIAHGCARPDRGGQPPRPEFRSSLVEFPARMNLTIPATVLPGLASRAGPGGSWSLTPRTGTGPPDGRAPGDGFGAWTLTLPGGRRLTVRLDPVPTFSCDHRYESHGYRPSGKLRHLVQIRDWTCTFPTCGRHARESDFEHAVPFHQGGRTDACNAGARSRACHRVKQSPGWAVTQPRPGWHEWTTPSGWTYTREPKRYPALAPSAVA